MSDLVKLIGWIAVLTMILAIVRQLSEIGRLYVLSDAWGLPFSQKGQDRSLYRSVFGEVEAFEDGTFSGPPENPEFKVAALVEKTELVRSGEPGPAALNIRQPYNLLLDSLSVKKEQGKLTAKACFDTDFLSHTDKIGNYIQRTNNFKHATPDNCSAPLTEMVDSFYKNT